jgi:uncharacterized protein YbjT (DUF2867 family)
MRRSFTGVRTGRVRNRADRAAAATADNLLIARSRHWFLDKNPSQTQQQFKVAAKSSAQLVAIFPLTPVAMGVADGRTEERKMKIVVIGGSGLIGTSLVNRLRQQGHDVVAASPASGVNTITREGLAEALSGAQVVVDVANSPSFEDKAVLEFFETSGRNLLAAEAAAGVRHHLALSVVGTDRLPDSGYMRAKVAQEYLIKASGIPYTILRATQFFEFINSIVQSGVVGEVIRLSPALLQPIAADDVAAALADLAVGPPLNAIVEIAGPEACPLDKLGQKLLAASGDRREVIADVHARYFGAELTDRSLTSGDHPRIGSTRFDDWLARSLAR